MNVYRTFTRGYARLLSWMLAATIAILVIPVSMQVFSRTIPLIPAYIWTEEMARSLFIWAIMIGAMIGVRDCAHFEVDLWPVMDRRKTAALKFFSGLFITGFALVFVWWGWEFTWSARYRLSELAELPLWLLHMAWPLAGFTFVVFQAEHLYDNARIFSGRAA